MADNEGEAILNKLLKQSFKKTSNYISANITLPINDGGTTQIDHILINEYGVFVIETKHFSGWVFASETNYQWTQSFANGQKFQFPNPIIQNKNHIKHLRQYLPLIPEKAFKSIIVFTGAAEFKTPPINNVINAEALVNCIEQFKEKVLSVTEIEAVIGKLEFRRKEQSAETDAEHIEYVQNKFKKKDIEKSEPIPYKPLKTLQDIQIPPRRETPKMNGITKFFINIILLLIIIGISGFMVLTLFKNMSNEIISKTQNPASLTPSIQPILETVSQNLQQNLTTEQPTQPAITKSTTSHRLGKICNTKKCIYQVEIVETTCYNGTGQCQVTHKSKGTETEILTP